MANAVISSRIQILMEEDKCIVSYRKKCDIAYTETKKFIDYINDSFLNISNAYNSSSCPGILPDILEEVNNYKKMLKKSK